MGLMVLRESLVRKVRKENRVFQVLWVLVETLVHLVHLEWTDQLEILDWMVTRDLKVYPEARVKLDQWEIREGQDRWETWVSWE
jgi:hypothetical protein